MLQAIARKLPRPALFALLYLRNVIDFDFNHVRTAAATHMDVELIKHRRGPTCRGRP
jgi:hypothetical protein